MAKLPSCSCMFAMATLLTFLVLPSLQSKLSRRLLPPLQLRLQAPPSLMMLNASGNNKSQHPLTPYLFSDQRLSYFDDSLRVHVNVGSANGLYLADPAASLALSYVFFTATLTNAEEGGVTKRGVGEGSLVMMGSVPSGAISVIGGTGDFAFASGEAQVSMAAAGGASEEIIVLLDVELQLEEDNTAIE